MTTRPAPSSYSPAMDGTRAARRRRWSWAGRIVLAGVLLAIAWPTSRNELAVSPATALPVALVVALPVLVAPEHPWRAWGASALGALLIALLVGPAPGQVGGVQAVYLVVLCGLTALVVGRCAPWAAAVAAVGLAGVFVLATGAAPEGFGLAIFWTAVVLAVGLLLRRVLTQRREIAVGRGAPRRRGVPGARCSRSVPASARDLHDVVAHSMSMVVVRAETARYRLPERPTRRPPASSPRSRDAARQALDRAARRPRRPAHRRRRAAEHSPRSRPSPTSTTLLAATSDAGVGARRVTPLATPRPRARPPPCRRTGSSPRPWPTRSRHAAGAAVAVTLDHGAPKPCTCGSSTARAATRRARLAASGCPGCASGPRRWAAS